jgi:hypothetical protein
MRSGRRSSGASEKKEFGPNQAQVDELLARLETVDQPQALFLGGFAGDDPARLQARRAVSEAARRGGREKELRTAQHEVSRWMNSWFTGGPAITGYGRDITPAQAMVDAAPMVLDAIGALVVRDLISADEEEILSAPWRELVSGPHLPESSA